MVSQAESDLITRVEGDAPLGRLMRDNYWIPFALAENLLVGDAPTPVRLFGENFVAWRADDGRIGFLDEHCPHRRASLLLARNEAGGLRCIYHGWKIEASGCVSEAPTQVVRAEQFCASVKVTHFPVHESGGIAWVWLGGSEAPPFPDLPFDERHGVNTAITFSVVPCNWLQGLEGGLDSVHGTIMHQSWIREILKKKAGGAVDATGTARALASVPVYEADDAPFGMTAASLRRTDEGTYVRIAHFFLPLVVVVPTGFADHTQIFCFSPVDDSTHVLFFGNYGPVRQMDQGSFGAVREDINLDPRNFADVDRDRSNRWGQDRELMDAGHWTGIDRSVIDEDVTVQMSMGPRVDHSKENLSGSDVAIATARRRILDAIAAYEAGELPVGSARSPDVPAIPDPFDAMIETGTSWRDLGDTQPVG